MTPTPIGLHNFKPSEPSTYISFRGTEAMHVQSALYSRSLNSGGTGVQENTIIFIVIGVVCLLVLLVGFYLVSRHHAASNAAQRTPSPHPQHSPIIHSPAPSHEQGQGSWKFWKTWCPTRGASSHNTPELPTVQVSPASTAIANPSRIIPARTNSKTRPPITLRPPQPRRVTSLSVATSFSHSHITEEALNDFRASAYDLDGDLETEMLNSARDDVWPGHPFAVEEGCGMGMEEVLEAQGSATPIVGGCVEDDAPTKITTQWKGSDYTSAGARESMVSENSKRGEEVVEVNTSGKAEVTMTVIRSLSLSSPVQ